MVTKTKTKKTTKTVAKKTPVSKNVTKKTVKKTSVTKKTTTKNKSVETSPSKIKLVKKTKEDVISKLRIRVRAYEYKILDLSVKQIIDTAMRYEARVIGPIPLPTEIKKYTVNRSPFIYKDSREQFEMRVHKRLIDIINPTPKIMEALTNMSLPSGVNIEVKIT